MGSNDKAWPDDTYTLRQMLGGKLLMVIPDMQRDYCWGTDSTADGRDNAKAPIFITGLVHLFVKGKTTPLGLLYGYERPAGSARINIIDGQQRLTTLYLLIGMLYRRTPSPDLRRLLISDYKLLDDREPRLIYQVRSEAMYFMSDLVTNFFLDRNGRLSQIENSDWYYSTYKSDTTIQSFINALRQIDQVLEEASKKPGWDFGRFAEFVTDRLTFMYHDLGSRQEAEKVFITINTTGQPLTMPQNFKSMLLALSSDAGNVMDKWDEIEQWGWEHREIDSLHPTTSDPAIERFLNIWVAHTSQGFNDALNPERFDAIYRFFTAYRTLVDSVPEALLLTAESAHNLYLLLPTIDYIRKFRYEGTQSKEARRNIADFWNFLANITRYQKVSTSGSDRQAARTLVNKLGSPLLTSLLKASSLPERLINKDELAKLRFLLAYGNSKRAHRVLRKGESHPMLNGRMERLLQWATTESGHVDIEVVEHYVDRIYQIWGTDISQRSDLDKVRVALLTLRHPGYPIVRRGDTCLTLCWQDYDWQRLMVNSPGLIKQLIDRIEDSGIPYLDALTQMANQFNDRTHPQFFLIKNPELLASCVNRMLLRPSKPFIGFYVLNPETKKLSTNIRWYVGQLPININQKSWNTMRTYGTLCLYTDHRYFNLTIDLYYTPDQRNKFRIEIFSRKDASPDREKPADIGKLIRGLGYPVKYDAKRQRHCTFLRDAADAVTMIHDLMSVTDDDLQIET